MADKPFEYEWEIGQDPQVFLNLFISETEEDPLALLWPLHGSERSWEFDVQEDFEDVTYPEELISPRLVLLAMNYDYYARDELVIASESSDQLEYNYQPEESEPEIADHREPLPQYYELLLSKKWNIAADTHPLW